MPKIIQGKKDILWLTIYGDQHHESCKELKKGGKVVFDGGSNIHINFLLRIPKERKIDIFTYQDNYQFKNFFRKYKNIRIKEFKTLSGLFNRFLLRIEVVTRCIYPGLLFIFKKIDYKYLVTQTDFLPDTWAAFLLKIRNPSIEWVASFFLAAPAPWKRDSPYHGKRWLIGFFYWILQIPSIWFIRWKADKILVTSEPDKKRFLNRERDESKIIVVQGGVDIEGSEKYLNSYYRNPIETKKYDACFSGRFHYQKGVSELVDIWDEVCKKQKDAKLIMIGGGPMEKEVREKIKKYKLAENINLVGFISGEKKYEIFRHSKIIVHPATYDSGGMAMAEGMAWGLPGVSFDLEALKTYYPKGVIKTPLGDNKKFAENILKLLKDSDFYEKTAKEAHDLIIEVWDWDKRAKRIYEQIF